MSTVRRSREHSRTLEVAFSVSEDFLQEMSAEFGEYMLQMIQRDYEALKQREAGAEGSA